jgi:3-oxoadipate CoA-transferase alpha subunit
MEFKLYELIHMAEGKVFPDCDSALLDVFDGATIMVGGFGSFGGLPIHLLVGLAKRGAKELTIISNQGGVGFELSDKIKPGGYPDIGVLYEKGQVKKFIGSVPVLGGMPPISPIEVAHREGKVEIEMVPQGTLAERIRAGAGGLGGFTLQPRRNSMEKEKKRATMVRSTCWNCL